MNTLRITPSPRIEGELAVPGDKSISHRSIIFASLATGPTRISGFLPGEDCINTLRAFQALGTRIEQLDLRTVLVEGSARKLSSAMEPIDCGNSGTTMRLISGILAGQPFHSKLFGDASLSRRPMKRIIEPLTQMGAKLTAEGAKGTPPLLIEGGGLHGITYHSPIASAQVKSCVLLAGLFASGTTTVKEPSQSRDHTERLFEHFHLPLRKTEDGLSIRGGSELHGEDLKVPGDFSSAAFWLAGAAAMPESNLIIRNLGLNATRTGLLNVLIRMGAQIRETIETSSAEPFGTIHIVGSELQGTEIRGAEIPNLIDELPIIAAIAALAKGQTIIRDASELRVKETDRIAIMAKNLRAFGVDVEELPDGMIISGGKIIRPAVVTSHGDHRIAMASAILALSAHGPSTIEDVDCINTSYPGFANHLRFLTERSTPKLPERVWNHVSGAVRKTLERHHLRGSSPVTIVAIDGPAASGKSTVSRSLAQRLGFSYINTGSMYRAIVWKLIQDKVDLRDPVAIAKKIEGYNIECGIEKGELVMRIDNVDPLPFVRENVVNQNVSFISSVPDVRHALLPLQQGLGTLGPVVVEGRDIGSHVFPNTPHKFYLDADPAVRAARRAGQGEQDIIVQRDQQDSARTNAPLQLADGAIRIDTGKMNLEEVVEIIVATLEKQGLKIGEAKANNS